MAVHIANKDKDRIVQYKNTRIVIDDSKNEIRVTTDFSDYITFIHQERMRLHKELNEKKLEVFHLEWELKRSWIARLLFGRLK